MAAIHPSVRVNNNLEPISVQESQNTAVNKIPTWIKPTICTALSVAGASVSFFMLYRAGFFSSPNQEDSHSIADRVVLPFRSQASGTSTSSFSSFSNIDVSSQTEPNSLDSPVDDPSSLPALNSDPNQFCPISNGMNFYQNGSALSKPNIDVPYQQELKNLDSQVNSKSSLLALNSYPNQFCPISNVTNVHLNGRALSKPNIDVPYQQELNSIDSQLNSPSILSDRNSYPNLYCPISNVTNFRQNGNVINKLNVAISPQTELNSLDSPVDAPSACQLSTPILTYCPIPALTDFDQNRNTLDKPNVGFHADIEPVKGEVKSEETSLARLSDLISNNLDFLPPVKEVWDILTFPILERPSLPLIGTVVSLLQISTQFKARSEQEKRYLQQCLNTFLRCFKVPSKMPEDMRIHLAMGMNLDTNEGWEAYVRELANLIDREGLKGFKRLWEPVLTADLPEVSDAVRLYKELEITLEFTDEQNAKSQTLLQQIFSDKQIVDDLPSSLVAKIASWRFQNMMRTMLSPGPEYNAEMAADYNYYSYLKDVRHDMGGIDFMLGLGGTSMFKVERVVENVFSFLLNAVLVPSGLVLATRSISALGQLSF